MYSVSNTMTIKDLPFCLNLILKLILKRYWKFKSQVISFMKYEDAIWGFYRATFGQIKILAFIIFDFFSNLMLFFSPLQGLDTLLDKAQLRKIEWFCSNCAWYYRGNIWTNKSMNLWNNRGSTEVIALRYLGNTAVPYYG